MPREVSFATFNLYNLQKPGKYVYRSKVKKADYDAKVAWSAALLKDAMPDVVAFQELWARECLEDVFAKAGLKNKYRLRYIGDSWGGIAVAAAARNPWRIVDVKVHKAFPDGFKLLKRKRTSQEDADRHDDDIEVSIDRFSRTIIQLTVKHQDGKVPPIEVFCVHLKAKLPTNLDREDKNDPVLMAHANALGAAISTIRRTAEAAALRVLLNGIMNDTETPVVVMGDFNDGLLSNTLSIITGQPPYKLFQAKKISKAKKVGRYPGPGPLFRVDVAAVPFAARRPLQPQLSGCERGAGPHPGVRAVLRPLAQPDLVLQGGADLERPCGRSRSGRRGLPQDRIGPWRGQGGVRVRSGVSAGTSGPLCFPFGTLQPGGATRVTNPDPKPLWTADEISAVPEMHLRHPWNPNSDVYVRPLSMGAGLSRSVLSLARVPPGKESFIYHSHERDLG